MFLGVMAGAPCSELEEKGRDSTLDETFIYLLFFLRGIIPSGSGKVIYL